MTRPEQPGRTRVLVAVLVVAFGVLAAGTASGWLVPGVRLVAVAAMAILIGVWLRYVLGGADWVDAGVCLLLGANAVAVATSIVPRLGVESLYASLAYVALFGVVRRTPPANRAALITAMSMLGAVLVLAFMVLWARTWVQWMQLTGILPSLALRLPSAPFGHPHDVPLLLGLLVPAIFVAPWSDRSTIGKIGAIAIAVALILFSGMSGGRGVWFALAGATLVVAISSRRTLGWLRRRWTPTAAVVLVGVVAVWVTGLGSVLFTRLTATASLDLRFDIWRGALTAASEHPVFGSGPGTFSFVLQSTGYFDHVAFEPAHADSTYLQALTELGMVGALAASAALVAVGVAWRHRRPPAAALWALAFAGLAGVTANPTALGYGAILIVTWAALATPFREARWRAPRLSGTVAVPVSVVGVGLVTLATTAALAFDGARDKAIDRPRAAIATIDAAVAADPSFPLYRRERGSLLAVAGHADEAVRDLEIATSLNPWDDTAFRSLAIARVASGDAEGAFDAAEHAVALQRTDPLNHATLAYVAHRTGDQRARDEALTTLVQLAPWAAADPAWEAAFPDVDPADVVRWAAASSAGTTNVWPAALSGIAGMANYSAAQSAVVQLVSCEPDGARSVLAGADPAERRSGDYWLARAIVAEVLGEDASAAIDTFVMLGSPVRREGSPFGAPLIDERAYARLALPHGGLDFPSQDDGMRSWISDPQKAIAQMRGDAGCAGS
jgi:tetratricopeptide (TPR) repeat protein